MEGTESLIPDLTLSERESNSENANSIMDKSILTGDITFPQLVENKNSLQIKLNPFNIHMQLSSKSVKNIFTKMSKNSADLEDNYFDYIVCFVANNQEKSEEISKIENIEPIVNLSTPLDHMYMELLSKTKKFNINFSNNYNKLKINKNIAISNISLNKICKFLNSNIFEMSDFIEVVILSFDEKNNNNISIEQENLLKSKILGKSFQNTLCTEDELRHRKMKLEPKKANKAKKNYLDRINKYFENVLNYIENKEKTPMGKNNLITFSNSLDPDDFSVHVIPNSHTNDLKNLKNKEDSKKKLDNICNENCCAETPCAAVCHIF